MSDTPRLNYAPPPPVYHRRIFHRWVYTAVLFGAIASGWWWLPLASRRVRLLYWQDRCMKYTPAAQTIFDSDRHICITPVEWSRFYSLYSPPGSNASGTAFLHEMTGPAGQHRLVAVDIFSYRRPTQILAFTADCRVFVPGTLLHPPWQNLPIVNLWTGPFYGTHSLAVNAGKIDPSDASHFTFDCIEDGNKTIYDGWLQNDDSVVISQRKKTPPAP